MKNLRVKNKVYFLGRTLPKDELANVITHGFGALMCLVFIPNLLWAGSKKGDQNLLAGLIIFGVSLFLVYLASTFYHIVQDAQLKYRLRIVDHISIYFLIAGTHTPFLLYYLNNGTGQFYLILLWTLVLIGTIYKLFFFASIFLSNLVQLFFHQSCPRKHSSNHFNQ